MSCCCKIIPCDRIGVALLFVSISHQTRTVGYDSPSQDDKPSNKYRLNDRGLGSQRVRYNLQGVRCHDSRPGHLIADTE